VSLSRVCTYSIEIRWGSVGSREFSFGCSDDGDGGMPGGGGPLDSMNCRLRNWLRRLCCACDVVSLCSYLCRVIEMQVQNCTK